MRRRLLLMVLSVTALTVGATVVLVSLAMTASVYSTWQARADDTARVTAAAIAASSSSDETTKATLSALTRDSAELTVKLRNGQTVSTGSQDPDNSFVSVATSGGVTVTAAIPKAAAATRIREIEQTLLAAVLVAMAIGMLGAWWYSRRLTEPLLHFVRTADLLSTGDRRTLGTRYGIAELDAVAEVLDRAIDSFNSVLEAERRLTVDASHQLRTPLTALSLRLEEIVSTDDLEAARAEAALALEQVERLAGVSEHLVAMARGSRAAPVVPFDVDRLVRAALAEWSASFRSQRREVLSVGATGLVASGSFGAQSQVIATLLENSLVHGTGTATVLTRTTGDWVVIEVRDEGVGIERGMAPAVFERGVTGTSSSGNGLGLALARTLAAADGGRLELLSAVPAVFALFLPAGEALEPNGQGPGAPGASSQPVGAVRTSSVRSTSAVSRKTHLR
ncbi:MAG TPA: HAMP domain-containing sensor histidine kinase [Candidatus Nanopelagicales bacterium]